MEAIQEASSSSLPSSSTAAEREARIAARRKRVQERLAALRAQAEAAARAAAAAAENGGTTAPGTTAPVPAAAAPPPQPSAAALASAAGVASGYPKAAQQVLESQRRLLRARARSTRDVTAVRVAADSAEGSHRAAEEQMRQDLRSKILDEAERSAAANARVAAGWPPLLSIGVPQKLWAAMEEQRAACEAVIASKDALVAELRGAVRSKDDEYVKLLKRQAQEVDALLAAMAQQLSEVGQAYGEELAAVEAALMAERGELLASNEAELAGALAARKQAEQDFTDKYLASMERYQQQLDDLRAHDAEEFHVLKIRLESDIATLEQHLGRMRAAYQLNAEKLDYNHRVLAERDAENTATVHQQKRKLSQQLDVLAALKQKYAAATTRHQDDNSKLTEEYRRVTEQFKDLQAKLRHFEATDAARFRELWRLQQSEATALAKRLLDASRVIHEQQLGWQWQPPDERVLFTSPHDLPSPNAASGGGVHTTLTVLGGRATGTQEGALPADSTAPLGMEGSGEPLLDFTQGHPSSDGGRASGSGVDRSSNGGLEGSGGEGGGEEGAGEVDAAVGAEEDGGAAAARAALRASAEVESRLSEPRYLGALALLCDEAGFLVDAKAADLVSKLPVDEADRVKAASIVRALGVTDGPGFDALMDALTDAGRGGGAFSAGAPDAAPPLLVAPEDAVRRLREFIEYEQSQPSIAPGGGTSQAGGWGSSSGGGGGAGAAGGARASITSTGSRHGGGGAARVSAAGSGRGPPVAGAGKSPLVPRRVADKERDFWARLPQAVGDAEWRAWCALESQLGRYHGLLTDRAAGVAAVRGLRAQNDELRALLRSYLAADINQQLQVPPTALI